MEETNRVSDAIYEKLKALAALREPCELEFETPNSGVTRVQTTILDVFEDADGQFLLAANGLTLQLHQLRAINGKPLTYFC